MSTYNKSYVLSNMSVESKIGSEGPRAQPRKT